MTLAAKASGVAPLSILVADDNADAAESLAILLQLEGHTVHVAADGVKALDLAARARPDVAVLDVAMPGLDGHELARRLRLQPWGHGMLIVALTGWAEDRERALAAGFDRHFGKPLHPQALLQCLADWQLGAGARLAPHAAYPHTPDEEPRMHRTDSPSLPHDEGHQAEQAPGGAQINRAATVATSAALGGAAAGAMAGAMAGPLGAAVGAAIGAVAAGIAGNSIVESIDREAEAAHWRDHYRGRPYVDGTAALEDYAPAYAWGVDGFVRHAGRPFDDAEAELSQGWADARGTSQLDWERALPAIRDAWERLGSGDRRTLR